MSWEDICQVQVNYLPLERFSAIRHVVNTFGQFE